MNSGPSRCYSCVYSHNPDADDSCATDVTRIPASSQVLCPLPKVCSTFRQWDKGDYFDVLSLALFVGAVENHGNTEITENVIFVKCRESRDFAKMP